MTCKYCGAKTNQNTICPNCYKKVKLLPRFAMARDGLRVLCGLPPMSKYTKKEQELISYVEWCLEYGMLVSEDKLLLYYELTETS